MNLGLNNLNFPCIYQIYNSENHKSYIGSSRHPQKRQGEHVRALRSGKHHSIALQRAWNKYGDAAFSFRLLELVCDPAELVPIEQRWLDRLKPEYNTADNANAPMLGRKQPKWYVEALRVRMKGSGNPFFGRTHRPETRAILRNNWLKQVQTKGHPRIGTKHTEETKKLFSKLRKGKPGPVISRAGKLRLSQQKMGNKHALGCTRSPETRLKMSAASIERWSNKQYRIRHHRSVMRAAKLGKYSTRLGIPHTLESRKKMSLRVRESWRERNRIAA